MLSGEFVAQLSCFGSSTGALRTTASALAQLSLWEPTILARSSRIDVASNKPASRTAGIAGLHRLSAPLDSHADPRYGLGGKLWRKCGATTRYSYTSAQVSSRGSTWRLTQRVGSIQTDISRLALDYILHVVVGSAQPVELAAGIDTDDSHEAIARKTQDPRKARLWTPAVGPREPRPFSALHWLPFASSYLLAPRPLLSARLSLNSQPL